MLGFDLVKIWKAVTGIKNISYNILLDWIRCLINLDVMSFQTYLYFSVPDLFN